MYTKEQLNQYFAIRAQWWNDAVAKLSADSVASVLRVMSELREEIRRELLENVSSFRAERLAQVDAWISEVLVAASSSVASVVLESSVITASASLEAYNSMLSLDGASQTVRTVGFTREQLVSWFKDTEIFEGMSLTTRVNNAMDTGVRSEIVTTLQKAGLEGKGTSQTVSRVLNTAVDAGFQMTEREAVTLVRSYVQAANIGAMDAVMEANKNLIRSWRWMATLGNKTCILCASLDGNMYRVDEKSPIMPRHYNCRCTRQWIANNPRDFGLSDNEIQRLTRSWIEREAGAIGRGGNRKILNIGKTDEFYGEWFKSMSKANQDSVVGAVRAGLLRDGSISWSDLVNRTTGELKTLKELGFDMAGNKI